MRGKKSVRDGISGEGWGSEGFKGKREAKDLKRGKW